MLCSKGVGVFFSFRRGIHGYPAVFSVCTGFALQCVRIHQLDVEHVQRNVFSPVIVNFVFLLTKTLRFILALCDLGINTKYLVLGIDQRTG